LLSGSARSASVATSSSSLTLLVGTRVALVHRQALVLQLLGGTMRDWGVDVVGVPTMTELEAKITGTSLSSFLAVCVDLQSVLLSAEESPSAGHVLSDPASSPASASSWSLLQRLHTACRAHGVRVIVLVPLGHARRNFMAHADIVLSHPLKAAQLQQALMSQVQRRSSALAGDRTPALSDFSTVGAQRSSDTGASVSSLELLAGSNQEALVPADIGQTPGGHAWSVLSSPPSADGLGGLPSLLVDLPSDSSSPPSCVSAPVAGLSALAVNALVSPRASMPMPSAERWPVSSLAAFAAAHPMRILIAEDNSVRTQQAHTRTQQYGKDDSNTRR